MYGGRILPIPLNQRKQLGEFIVAANYVQTTGRKTGDGVDKEIRNGRIWQMKTAINSDDG